jgi:hypothetical protein
MIQEVTATITTTSGGAATVYLGSTLTGRVHAIKYAPGALDTGAGLTITGETTGVPILTKASAGTSTVWYYPRAFANKVTDGAAFTDVTEDVRVLKERIKVVVASGGNALTGAITAYVDTETYSS